MINENDAKESLIEIYSNLRYKPEYKEYKHDCPERMWPDKSLSRYNCDDEDGIEDIFDKMAEEALEVCPVVLIKDLNEKEGYVVIEKNIIEGCPVQRPKPDNLITWIADHNRETFKNIKIPELEMLQKEEEE